jgi:4-deoxy-L-threo-5-hexosulose-uronate ketol-isomerase
MNTQSLRDAFLISGLFDMDKISLTYCEVERGIVGSAVPANDVLYLESVDTLKADFFCQRRELGVLNIGGKGSVTCDDTLYALDPLDCLYIGMGTESVNFASDDPDNPAKFYLLSYPAHAEYPTTHASIKHAAPLTLGSTAEANRRTIYQYIHPTGVQSCQLAMGFTVLDPGNVWNTMPAHVHVRRTEVHMYFDLNSDGAVFHFMGPQDETRHIAVHNEQAVLSPMWSIHSGCGTQAYSFCWGTGGENQRFDDMEHITNIDLR